MDALVKLYDLPENSSQIEKHKALGIIIRRAMPYEKSSVYDWICKHFSTRWADECSTAFLHQPATCFIAVRDEQIVGFACHECTQKNYFGPMGVVENARHQGIGRKLLLSSLWAMQELGYAYAIIGGCDGVQDYYKNTCNAQIIEGSTPGIYSQRIF